MNIMDFSLKWVHMARYELILRLDGALGLTIIFRPLLTPKRANNASFGQWEARYQNPLYQQKARAHIEMLGCKWCTSRSTGDTNEALD